MSAVIPRLIEIFSKSVAELTLRVSISKISEFVSFTLKVIVDDNGEPSGVSDVSKNFTSDVFSSVTGFPIWIEGIIAVLL